MRRSLVLYNESKRHWLRQQLPAAALAVETTNLSAKGTDKTESLRLFLMTFTAGFLAFSTFIC